MIEHSGFFKFRIDPLFDPALRRYLDGILSNFKDAEIVELKDWGPVSDQRAVIDFVSENSLHLIKNGDHFRICLLGTNQGLFSFGQNIEKSGVNAILGDNFDLKQLERLVHPRLQDMINKKEETFLAIGNRNLKKFESMARLASQKIVETRLASDSLLDYVQALVDLEKSLIHVDDPKKYEKVIRQFAKVYIEKLKIQFHSLASIWKLRPSKELLLLPRHKGKFQAIEINWEDEDEFNLIRKFFFYHTLVIFFRSQQEIQDPFFDTTLWENALDAIPFPVVLMSENAEVHQHNSLFGKLNFPPKECLNLRIREKKIIGEIPYNVFRKDIHHFDGKKILFVFFTESFFLKGEGNLTPSGQELGIISSSIAHELNNPIAGIQAALTLLMLDDTLDQEMSQTLNEMKNGAMRCKQLIETFLGFSRANPAGALNIDTGLSSIGICYQQAQNLLRFRTVESGIRFSLEYSKHTDFRHSINISLLTMTFYLVMGELMTLYSHQLLVANKNQIEKVIKGEIVESSQEIQIQLHELNISELALSKLIQNLLKIENFVLQISDYSLRFIYTDNN